MKLNLISKLLFYPKMFEILFNKSPKYDKVYLGGILLATPILILSKNKVYKKF
ncbi:MAG: hypothetical protein ACRC41_13045 [Sarcina sp.]